MKIALRDLSTNKWLTIGMGMAIGLVVFLCVYGFQVIIPTNVDWLLAGGDLSQHYIGWEFYRQPGWSFPIGVASDLAYPHGLAITFMDSLPLFAIPFKLFAGLLPEHFQYFGLWGVLSYMTMGALTGLIARRFTMNTVIILLIVIFMCFSPLVFQRMFLHTALAGQWILLAGTYAVLCAKEWRLRTNVIAWSSLLALSVLIHPYFLPMSIFLLLVSTVLRYKEAARAAIEVSLPLVVAVATTWLIGGFTFTTISGQKFGGAGSDLAAIFLPNGWSVIGSQLPQTKFETYAYLGLGGLLLIAAATALLIKHRRRVAAVVRNNHMAAIVLASMVMLLLLIAIGPTIKIGGATVFSYNVPESVEKIWGIFRVTARLAWPLWYGLLIMAIIAVIRFTKPRTGMLIIAAACIVQVVDIGASHQLAYHHNRFVSAGSATFESPLSNPAWKQLAMQRRHLVYLGDLYDEKFVNLAQFCLSNNLTINTGYFARKPTRDIDRTITEARTNVASGNVASDTIYLYDKPYAVSPNLQRQVIDGYTVVTKQ